MGQYRLPNLRKIISQIQKDAYAGIGLNEQQLRDYFHREKLRLQQFLEDKPDYLRTREEILEEDPSLDYIELDLVSRFDTEVPTPYQHPYFYSWLVDSWIYHCEKAYGRREIFQKEVLLVSAPTGRFNAMALVGKNEDGILIEDGLWNLLIGAANQLAFLLFERAGENQYRERNLVDLQGFVEANPQFLQNLADIIHSYVVEGYSLQPPPIGDSYRDDFAIRHVLTSACWSFIFEHELFHLRVASGEQFPLDRGFLEQRFVQIWTYFKDHLSPHLPVEVPKEVFKKRYLAHQEEIFADFFGLAAVIKLGRKDGTLAASLLGVQLFFFTAELTEFLLFRLTEKGSIEELYAAGDLTNALTAIVMGESHPYAFSRRAGLADGIKTNFPDIYELLLQESEKMTFLLDCSKEILNKRIDSASALPVPHSKWSFGKALIGKYLIDYPYGPSERQK